MRATLLYVTCIAAVAATPDPLITPRPALMPRQDNDPALLGWVDAVNGQYSDRRTCDYPATLSTSAALAQCCAPNTPCTFWQSCSAGILFAHPSTSLFCDQGYCNTAVLVRTAGAQTGTSYLGCWATSLGDGVFTIVQDIGGGAALGGSSSVGTGSSRTTTTTGGGGSQESSGSATAAGVTRVTGTASRSASVGATSSTGAGVSAGVGVKSFAAVFGMMAAGLGLV